MTLIHVPRPPKTAMDLNRPISSLVKAQIEHLQEAEKRLPLRHRSEIYTNAIKTESEAAAYVRAVTEAIHKAHGEAAARRAGRVPKEKRATEIAAVAEKRPSRKRTRGSKERGKKIARVR